MRLGQASPALGPLEGVLAEVCRQRYGLGAAGQPGVVCLPTEAAAILGLLVVIVVVLAWRR